MGMLLNPDNSAFQEALNFEIYIDKSMLIEETNKVIKTIGKYICVSRPRRFGKSLTAGMLTAYYSRGCDSREMFSKLKISKSESFKKHLNKYNVIYLNANDYLDESKNMDEMIEFITEDLTEELLDEFNEINIPKRKTLTRLLDAIYKKYYTSFVFIIDEWDCVFRNYQCTETDQVKYLNFLKFLLKDKTYTALAYMTGILPIKKYGQHSALNMFTEISMTDTGEFAEFTGFTEDEVKKLCSRYNRSYKETKKWYDGYNIEGKSIYNPRSVIMSIIMNKFNNYWTSTENYEALRKYITMNFDGLRDTIIKLLAGEKALVDTTAFVNDMTGLETKDDVLTLLIHLGYLTYDFNTKQVWIPNNEISEQFATTIKRIKWPGISESLINSEELLEAVWKCDEEKAAEFIDKVHSENVSILKYNDENSLACVLSIAFYSAKRYYSIYRELPSGKGYADLTFIPENNTAKPAVIVELKYDKSAETALKQIKSRGYTEGLKKYKGEVILVGINYEKNSADKKHECKIEKIIKK